MEMFEESPVVMMYERLPAAWPLHFTYADAGRAMAIMRAELERAGAYLAVMDELLTAWKQYPDAQSPDEALQHAGIAVADWERRRRAVPAPDEGGMRWLIAEHERAEGLGGIAGDGRGSITRI